MTRRAAICTPLRTPVGKFLGGLSSMNAGQLGAVILKALMERSGIDPACVDDVVFSQGYGNGEAPAIGHWSWLAAGLPMEVPGFQLDRRCGSGVQAVATAAMMVETGMADVVVAGGVESMSNVEHYTLAARGGVRMGDMVLHDRLSRGRVMSQPVERFGVITGMIETAENLAKDYAITREEADAFAVRSHQNAARAWSQGQFAEQLVPVAIPQRRGDPVVFDHDEGYRTDASMETLGKLAPIDGKRDPHAIVTAGNASQQNDAAAACLVVAEDKLEELGLTPMLWFGGWAAAGCDPSRMGIGPVPAVERLFERRGYSWDDIGLVELNEAFAPQVLAVLKGWGWSADDSRREILNVNGSGISLGHPIGATGGCILADMAHEMQRRGVRYGLETMCIGGGQGYRCGVRARRVNYEAWIGREQRTKDRLDDGLAARWLATFDLARPHPAIMPQGIHLALCTPEAPSAALGEDGHPARDDSAQGFLPPVSLPRRMWASSKIAFHMPIAIGAVIERKSRIAAISEKQGSTGPLAFVDVAHETFANGSLAVAETQSIVYREAASGGQDLSPPPLGEGSFDPAGWDAHRAVTPDARLLFRYSALTFNTHRIHYDAPYAEQIERYRGLVVHGPLIASLLLQLAAAEVGANRLRSFAFRGLSPAIADQPLHLVMRQSDAGYDLAAFAADGRQVTQASAAV